MEIRVLVSLIFIIFSDLNNPESIYMNITMIRILVLFFLLINFNAIAEKIPGYYITSKDDTIYVLIQIRLKESYNPLTMASYYEPVIRSLNDKIMCFDTLTKKKYILKPSQAKEFGFTYHNTDYTFLSRKDDLKDFRLKEDTCVFLRLQQDGYLKMFDCINKKQAGGGYNPRTGAGTGSIYMDEDQYILQKGDGILFQPQPSMFANQMSEFLSDYKELADQIADRKYKISDMMSIVVLYNTWKAIETRKQFNGK
jgi:hypothetical protein